MKYIYPSVRPQPDLNTKAMKPNMAPVKRASMSGGAFAPAPKARAQSKGAMPRNPGYFAGGSVF